MLESAKISRFYFMQLRGLERATEPTADELQAQVLSVKSFNPISGADVDADDVFAYIDDMKAMGKPTSDEGFGHWLSGQYLL